MRTRSQYLSCMIGALLVGAAVHVSASTPADPIFADGFEGFAPATLFVHYPANTHSISVRGLGGGLSWLQGKAAARTGDTFALTLELATPIEWKPLLDDVTYALGPTYHIAPGQVLDVWPHFITTQGTFLFLIPDFQSTVLGNSRPIYAYVPPSYNENTDATYPVVYMHDGQNLWASHPELAFGATWNVDTAFDNAANTGACSGGGLVGWSAQPLGGSPTTCIADGDCLSGECRTFPEAIVIGVANTANRIYEYTPTTDPMTPGGGGADLYLQMLVQELKPTIDVMLRTRPDATSTAMAGSTLGGLVTAYAGVTQPQVFGRIAELSPSVFWDNNVIVTDVMGTLPAPARPLIVYVDSGTGSGEDPTNTNLLAAAYVAVGYVDGTNFHQVTQVGGLHNETYWAQRFPGAMQFVLGPRD